MSCEHCDGSKKPIKTEVDDEAYIELTPDDYEYPEGFLLDVYKTDVPIDGYGTWMYSFMVPCCPMCGRKLKEGE